MAAQDCDIIAFEDEDAPVPVPAPLPAGPPPGARAPDDAIRDNSGEKFFTPEDGGCATGRGAPESKTNALCATQKRTADNIYNKTKKD